MKKSELANQGIPMWVNAKKDLPGAEGASFDSFFVSCEFEGEDGNRYGVVWHQQTVMGQFMTAQILLADPANARDINIPFTGMNGMGCSISNEKLECISPLGTLSGDEKEMHLTFEVEGASGDLILRPTEMVLYNGGTGLLYFLSSMDNHQFSFPTMEVEGTFTLDGKTHQIKNTTDWFDRQWGFNNTSNQITEGEGLNRLSWAWIGFPLGKNREEAISLWDSFALDGRYAFATKYNADGTQVNHVCDITYKDVWKSEVSGSSYPGGVHVEIPTAEISLDLDILPGDPEFYHPENGLCGFEALCKINGTYKGEAIDRYGFLEIIGDVCGEV